MKLVDDRVVLYMQNSATAIIVEIDDVELKFTFEKIVILFNIFYVKEFRKKLVSGSLLNKFGFKLVFEANNLYLLKGVCFRKRVIYLKACSNSIFMLII